MKIKEMFKKMIPNSKKTVKVSTSSIPGKIDKNALIPEPGVGQMYINRKNTQVKFKMSKKGVLSKKK